VACDSNAEATCEETNSAALTNWHSSRIEGLVRVNLVQVQVLSPALQSGQEVTANPGLLPCAFRPPHGKVLVKRFA